MKKKGFDVFSMRGFKVWFSKGRLGSWFSGYSIWQANTKPTLHPQNLWQNFLGVQSTLNPSVWDAETRTPSYLARWVKIVCSRFHQEPPYIHAHHTYMHTYMHVQHTNIYTEFDYSRMLQMLINIAFRDSLNCTL